MSNQYEFMKQAVELSRYAMHSNEGGPFGCVVVKDGIIIGRGSNQVLVNNDPTAHAEVVAIRDACHNLQTIKLDGCELYTSCEPCPMCTGAIYWARLKAVYYGNTRKDAAAIGFDDDVIYCELEKKIPDRSLIMQCFERNMANEVFAEWENKSDKMLY